MILERSPKGDVIVVSSKDSQERGICQNPKLASSFENTLAAVNWASI